MGEKKTADALYELNVNLDSDFLSSWPTELLLTLPDFKDFEDFFKDLEDGSSSSEAENESSADEKEVGFGAVFSGFYRKLLSNAKSQ